MKQIENRQEKPESNVKVLSHAHLKKGQVQADESGEADWNQFLERFKKLRQDTNELRNSLTRLQEQTNSIKGLSDSHRECILRICDVICKKHNELIYSERLMKEVVQQLYKDATF